MSSKMVSIIYELMDDPNVDGQMVKDLLDSLKAPNSEVIVTPIAYEPPEDTSQFCDFIKIIIKGKSGKSVGGSSPTIGIIGRLGAQQAQPNRIGMVSDADGSIVTLATAMKLLWLAARGTILEGDVIITTHIATKVSIQKRLPVDFMGAPVSMETLNKYELCPEMDAILSIDTSRGNRIIKHRGMAISPTVKQGYILPVANQLIDLFEHAVGGQVYTFPLSLQDITPYNKGFKQFNSIMQPHTGTDAPVVGLAITAKSLVAGCATGASTESSLVDATLFAVEVAKQFASNNLSFYDEEEYARLVEKYGELTRFQH